MGPVEYRALNHASPKQLLSVLNKEKVRSHLKEHEIFDEETLQAWLNDKIRVDSSPGCRVRAVVIDEQCVGWCGIQENSGKYEIAIILDDSHWGLGRKIFRDLMDWAKDLGHQTIAIHFLHTRPDYKFLRNMAKSVYKSDILGDRFTTYMLAVE